MTAEWVLIEKILERIGVALVKNWHLSAKSNDERINQAASQIIEALTEIKKSFEKGKIPSEEGHRFVQLVNITDEDVRKYDKRYPFATLAENLKEVMAQVYIGDSKIREKYKKEEIDPIVGKIEGAIGDLRATVGTTGKTSPTKPKAEKTPSVKKPAAKKAKASV